MAASALDKARKSYSYLQKTLSAQISDTDTTLTPNNVTNIPTDTGVSFVVDRVDSSGTKTPTKRELMTGRVSAGTITGLIRGEQGTTAQIHTNNAVIEFVNSGEMWNDLIDFMLQDHSNPNGNHKTLTDDNGNEWLERGSTASAVNQVKITNNITGKAPKVSASGDDATIQLDLDGKGTGGYAVARNPELVFDHIVAGSGVWSGLGYGTTLTAAMTAATCYINGRRIVIAAIATRTFTASKDTYVDVLDNLDGTGTVVYTEVANNAASPALAANSVRMAIIVSGATIAAVGSINQGEDTKVLPIASSIPYAVTDSLGNLICPRDPARKLLGMRQITTSFSTASGTAVAVTGLTVPVIVPLGRKIKISFDTSDVNNNTLNAYANVSIFDGSIVDPGNRLTGCTWQATVASTPHPTHLEADVTPTAASKTYILAAKALSGGSAVINAFAAGADAERGPSILKIELA